MSHELTQTNTNSKIFSPPFHGGFSALGIEKKSYCRLVYKSISANVKLQSLVRYFSTLNNPAILGAAEFNSDRNRYSYFAAEPVEVFECLNTEKKPLEKLKAVLNKYHLEERDCHDLLRRSRNDIRDSNLSLRGHLKVDEAISTPKMNSGIEGVFTGGWLGFFSYDLNRHIENIPTAEDDICLPLIRLCFYDKVICFDHIENCFHLFAIELPNDKTTGEEKIKKLETCLAAAANGGQTPNVKLGANQINKDFKSNITKDYYLDAIAKTKKYIYDGDVYQINFSQRFSADFNADAYKLFLWQNKFNPSPYSAYIDAGDFQIVSASPELFISINNGTITTCPIKGTRPRTDDEKINKENCAELIANEKEKAELDMIIDLERNDLGRICKPGTIKVVKRRDIETFATVFHAVATIQGRLKEKIDFVDILKAIFPGGSITGAPKISAMKIINELEPTARGLYTGCIGWIDLKGNACLNIVIRTIIIKGNTAFAQTGGGIVADSIPQAEWEETLIKAKALLAGIKAVQE
ncbi:MAG: anthranilate synthase component I family protein [Sedimentisphaerales bacterium]|nr:anthranilate synthase component I family protein [Sedimentisphaerales bacterium]